MSRARDLANLGDGISASDITTGTLGNTVQDNITRLGTVTSGTFNGTFPAGNIVKVYFAEYTLSASTTYAASSWHDIPSLSITTDTPKSTSSKFLLFGHTVHGSNNDWSAKFRFYNATTSSAVSNATTRLGSNLVFSNFIGGHNYPSSASDMMNGNGMAYQSSNNGSAQNFKLQGYSGRTGYILNRMWSNTNDDISSNACICSLVVMEIA